jgi:NAD(P)-dependent dehydrogenase (short-subunit alcohol dehydrogenase family)
LGKTIAKAFAAEGAHVAINDVTQIASEDAAGEVIWSGGKASAHVADVTDERAVVEMMTAIEADIGPIDVLVSNAGIGDFVSWPDITTDKWQLMLNTHLSGSFYACKAVLPSMIDRGRGAIVNISSVAGKRGDYLGNAHYTAAKSGIIGLTRSLAADVASKGVRVNSVAPGLVQTELSDQMPSEMKRRTIDRIPIGRLGRATEIADAVLFLASDQSSYIIGETLSVNGGSYMD